AQTRSCPPPPPGGGHDLFRSRDLLSRDGFGPHMRRPDAETTSAAGVDHRVGSGRPTPGLIMACRRCAVSARAVPTGPTGPTGRTTGGTIMTGTPYELLDRLTAWATGQGWIDWLELGGSLGRGGGDAWSDIDAGIGVADGAEIESRRDEALRAIAGFAPVADTLVQSFPSGWHCVAAYADGRQLSLVVLPAEVRTGLPPQSRALLDRSGRLARPLPAERWAADAATRRE